MIQMFKLVLEIIGASTFVLIICMFLDWVIGIRAENYLYFRLRSLEDSDKRLWEDIKKLKENLNDR